MRCVSLARYPAPRLSARLRFLAPRRAEPNLSYNPSRSAMDTRTFKSKAKQSQKGHRPRQTSQALPFRVA